MQILIHRSREAACSLPESVRTSDQVIGPGWELKLLLFAMSDCLFSLILARALAFGARRRAVEKDGKIRLQLVSRGRR
jgi:hypothetical protein